MKTENGSRFMNFALWSLALISLLTACGKPDPLNLALSPETLGQSTDGKGGAGVALFNGTPAPTQLAIRVLPGAADGLMHPDRSAVAAPYRVLDHGDELVFLDVIQLQWKRARTESADPSSAKFTELRPLYLALIAGAEESPIQQLLYRHRTQDARNRSSGDEERRNGQRDPEQDLWYVPLTGLLDLNSIDSAQQHELIVDIQRANLKWETRRILFRISPPSLKSVQIIPQTLDGLRPSGWVTEIVRRDIPLRRETLRNPGVLPVTIQIEGGSQLQLTQRAVRRVLRIDYLDLAGRPVPVAVARNEFVASAVLSQLEVELHRSDAPPEHQAIEAGTSSSMTLAAGERIELIWWAKPARSINTCPLDGKTVEANWKPCLRKPGSIFGDCRTRVTYRKTERFREVPLPIGSGVTGRWTRRFWVLGAANETSGDEPGYSDVDEQVFAGETNIEQNPMAALRASGAPLSCSGLF